MFLQSKHMLVVLAFLLHNGLLFSQGNTDCPSPTFFKTFGAEFQAEYATAIIRSSDNHLFLAGRDGGRTFIQKMTTSGVIVWNREFQISAFESVTPREIIQDSDGMIVGCGTQGVPGLSKGFVFRYDPVNNVLLWAQQIASNNPTASGILEKGPGGNFVFYQTSLFGSGEQDAEIIEIDRLTGVFIPSLAKRYEHISSDAFSKMIYVNGVLYATGSSSCRFGDVNLVNSRQLLARFNATNYDPVWAKLNHLDTLAPVSFLGRDLLADGNTLVSAYVGSNDLVINGTGNDTIYLQKTDLEGNIQWVRSYNIQAGILKLLALPDGYVIYGQKSAGEHLVFKTDTAGVPVWGRSLTETQAGAILSNNFAPNQAVAIGDSLYFTGLSANGGFDIFLWKMYGDGSMADSCGVVDTLAVQSTLVLDPMSTPVALSQVFSTATTAAAAPGIQNVELLLHQFCPDCFVPDLCPEDNDFIVRINDVYCEQGKINMQFTFCDLEGGAVPPLSISFFDADPYVQEANLLGTYDYAPITADSCWSIELTDLVAKFGAANVVDGAKIFAVVNVPGNAETPFILDDFPLSDYAECNYINNLDVYTIQLPSVPTLNLGADQTICPNQSAMLDAGAGFFKYQWSNGQTTQAVAVSFSGEYRVTVTDLCGFRQIDTIAVTVRQTPQLTLEGSFCPGKSVTVQGFLFAQSGIFQRTLTGFNDDCDTLVTFFITELPYQTRNEIVRFCPGETVTINNVTYDESGLAKDTLAGNIGCDTIVFYFLNQLPAPFRFDTAYICPGDSVKVGDYYYSEPGLVYDTLPNLGPFGCDTIIRVRIFLLPQITVDQLVQFCPGTTVTIEGLQYDQPGTLSFIIPATGGGCDTLLQYTLEWLPAPTISNTIAFCQGASVILGGNEYFSPGTVQLTVPGLAGECDTLVTYTLEWLPGPTAAETILFCPGTSVTIGGAQYTQPGTVMATIPGQAGECDTLVTYTLEWLPGPTSAETIQFCPGTSVQIGGNQYTQPGAVLGTIAGTGGGCDTLVTYTLEWLPFNVGSESLSFCPGQTVMIGGNAYSQPGTVLDTIPSSSGGCDVIVTYTLTFTNLPTKTETVAFCAGSSVNIGGQTYTMPGIVVATVPGAAGACDTLVTYTLQYQDLQPSTLTATCPFNVNVTTTPGTGPIAVNYNQPVATSDCTCPGIAWTLTAGLTSGSLFPPGLTKVCYTAKDSCGSTDNCCFDVIVREEGACDAKTSGCMKYELLSITADAQQRYSYRIRVTNNCANKMIYTAIELPNGVVAVAPANNSVFESAEGTEYLVRNPNYTPFWSIRFKSNADSIANGESSVLEYTLPPQSHPTYIHVMSRLAPQLTYEAHLNTFYCPIGATPINRDESTTDSRLISGAKSMLLFPNPTSGLLFADLSDWQGESLALRVLDSRGQLVQAASLVANETAQPIQLPTELPSGLYFLEILTGNGEREVGRFVVER